MDSKIEKARLGAQGDASSWVWNGTVNTLADLASIAPDVLRFGKGIGCALFNDQASGYDRAWAVARDVGRGLTVPGVGIAARATFRAAKGIGKATTKLVKDIKRGKEYVPFGNRKTFRVAPWGNRTGHQYGRYPHYHRQGPKITKGKKKGETKAGQTMKRHRPFEPHKSDTSFWDRF